MESVESNYFMFFNCQKLKTINGNEYWKLVNSTSTNEMFTNCWVLKSLDTSNWSLKNVKNMACMFIFCYALETIGNTSSWSTSNVETMNAMFYDCNSLTSLNTSSWNTEKVADMSCMFHMCTSLKLLDCSSWSSSSLTKITNNDGGQGMFDGCALLESVTFGSNFTMEKVESTYFMFYNCLKLKTINGTNYWKLTNNTNMHGMFQHCEALTNLDVSSFETKKVTSIRNIFSNCKVLTSLNVSNWNTEKVTDMAGAFNDCNVLTSLCKYATFIPAFFK
jgi:surface protein